MFGGNEPEEEWNWNSTNVISEFSFGSFVTSGSILEFGIIEVSINGFESGGCSELEGKRILLGIVG